MADINTIDFFDHPAEVVLQGHRLYTIGLEKLLLYLCIHGAKHQWERLEWIVDIAYLIKGKDIDWEKMLTLIYQSKSEKIVLSSFHLCQVFFNVELPPQVNELLKNKNISSLSEQLIQHFVDHFDDHLHTTVQTKTISLLQFRMLHGFKNKWFFISSLFRPTQLDYLSAQLPEQLTFLYYFIRPINIFKRWKNKF
jgi:hypothetical protein